MKSIEENSRAVTNEVFKKLVYITSGTGISKEELVELVDLINDTAKQAVNASLEEARKDYVQKIAFSSNITQINTYNYCIDKLDSLKR